MQHEAAQRGEEPENARQPVMTPPWLRRSDNSRLVTPGLVAINAGVFLGMALAGISLTAPNSQQLLHWGANYGPLTLGGQWWRLVTSLFLHIGIIHLAFNMWCLWDLGALCESLYGPWTFGAVYLISGVGASLTSLAWNSNRVSAGASGAIFGIAGALIASYYLGEFSLPRGVVQGSLRSVVLFAGYNLVFGAIAARTDNAAHLGGLATGLILGVLITRMAPTPDEPVSRISVVLLVAVAVVGGGAWLQHSRSYMVHLQRGTTLLAQNKPDEAIAELQAAVRQRPNYVPAHFELAHAYATQPQYDKAEAELKRVLDLEPKNEYAYYLLGLVYFEQNRIPEAKDTYRHLLALDPQSPDAHLGLGLVARAEGDQSAAIEEFQIAANSDTELTGAYYNMGLAYSKLKKYDEAIAALQKEQERSGDDYDTEIALAAAYQGKGMQQQAGEALQKAAQLKSRR